MDSIDYYNRYAVPYFEKTAELDMEKIIRPFIELMPENAEILDLGCGSGRDTVTLVENGFFVTALDGSEEMCKLAEVHTDQDVLHMTYEEMDFDDVFDGIWACASLVHLSEDEMKSVMKKLVHALQKNGVLYFSVHRGERDGMYNGRYFRDYKKRELLTLLEQFEELELLNMWTTQDVRSGKADNQWLNVLVRKTER